jgi:hypothetical protein
MPHAVTVVADVLRAGLVVVSVVVSVVTIGVEGLAIHVHVLTIKSQERDITSAFFFIAEIVAVGHVTFSQFTSTIH